MMWATFKLNAALFALMHLNVALACLAVARKKQLAAPGSKEVGRWHWYAGLLLLLGANTLWRLEEGWLASWRVLAQQGVWYAQRGALQVWVLVGLAACSLTALAWAVSLRRPARLKAVWAHPLVLAGLALLFLHLALRAMSWHNTDQLIYTRVAWISLGRWLDIGGLGLVTYGAWRRWRR